MVGAGRFELPTPCAQGAGTLISSVSITYSESIAYGHVIYAHKGGL